MQARVARHRVESLSPYILRVPKHCLTSLGESVPKVKAQTGLPMGYFSGII